MTPILPPPLDACFRAVIELRYVCVLTNGLVPGLEIG